MNGEPVPAVVWFTGLSGAGKTTLAERVAAELASRGLRAEHLDGDKVRSVFPSTGFSRQERDDHIRRVGFLASRLEAHGVFVVASFISPYRSTRDLVRAMCRRFIEVHVSTPIETCEARDVKGLYARARRGELKSFTGVDDPYEPPEHPELEIDCAVVTVDEGVRIVLDRVLQGP